ncbi:MAG TPA: Yip1 family protein [Pseudomonadales bacterium]
MKPYALAILVRPAQAWADIGRTTTSALRVLATHTALWALVPALCWYYGITRVGWQFGEEPALKISVDSAVPICALLYVATLAGIAFLGYMVHWMAGTYGASRSTFARGVAIASYTSMPFFVAGLLGLHPALWFDLAIGVAVACHCLYLLYLGVPIVMQIPAERGFLFASAVVAIALVGVVAMMGSTVLLWDLGAEPRYTY